MATTPKKKRAKKTKSAPAPAPTKKTNDEGVNEAALTKGEIRKLNALRKSVGDKLGEQTFAKWLEKRRSKSVTEPTDKNAELIADTIMGLIKSKNIRLPRGGYVITRGRGRVIVEAAK